MTTIARLLGGGSDSEKKMMRIYNFERDLAIVSYVSGIEYKTTSKNIKLKRDSLH